MLQYKDRYIGDQIRGTNADDVNSQCNEIFPSRYSKIRVLTCITRFIYRSHIHRSFVTSTRDRIRILTGKKRRDK